MLYRSNKHFQLCYIYRLLDSTVSRVAGIEQSAVAEFALVNTISKLDYMIPSANNLSIYNLELNVILTQLRYILDAISTASTVSR